MNYKHPIDSRPLAQSEIVEVKGKRYRNERSQGHNAHYTFFSLEEDAGPPFNKSYDEVFELLKTKKMIKI